MAWIGLTFWRRQAQVMHAGQLLLICIGLLWLGNWPSLYAQASSSPVRMVRAVYPSEWGVQKRAGLTYSANLNQFFLVKQGPPGDVAAGGSTIVALTPYENLVDTVQLDFSVDNAANAAFDDANNRLLLLNSQPAELVQIKIGNQGKLDPNTLTRFDLTSFGLQSADGIDLDRQSHQLFILDRKAQQVVQVTLTASGPDNTTLTKVDLTSLGFAQLRGLALNPANQHLYAISKDQNQLVEFTQAGQLVTTYDLTAMQLVAPRALVFAPSPDLTDAEDTIHLFVVDSKQADDQVANSGQPSWLEVASTWLYLPLITQSIADETVDSAAQKVRYGEIVEVAFDQPSNQVSAASTNVVTEQLVRTINTAAFSKPSPDPSGMTYLPNSKTILMTDGEVDETVSGVTFFAGANVWEMTLSGSVVRTTNIDKRTKIVIPITNEPTGVAWNPNNNHYYVTDDDNQEVYDVNPGADKLFGTTDDTFTSFDTASHKNMDPEGVTYAQVNNHIYVSDGENAEIYEYTTSGTLVNHFDVAVYGVTDPESVEFNPVNGTLFVLSNVGNEIIVETTTSGVRLNTYNFAASKALAPAGLAYAPASDGSRAMRFYIADRGVDNNDNPRENDGKIYEMTAPSASGSTATPTPATPTKTATPVPPTATGTPVNTKTPTPVSPTLNFSPSADAQVNDNYPTKNYGNSPELRVRSSGPAYHSYLKFVITGVSAPVQSAKLRLYVIDASTAGGSIYPVSNNYLNTTTPWTESGLTWQKAPLLSGAPLSTLGAVAVNTWVEYNVTAAIQGNGTYNFAISSTSTNSVYFNAKEATTNRPVLVISLTKTVAGTSAEQAPADAPDSVEAENQDNRVFLPMVIR